MDPFDKTKFGFAQGHTEWNRSMDKQTTLVASWFGATLTTLLFSLGLLTYLSMDQVAVLQKEDFGLYAALPSSNLEIADGIERRDGRAKIIEDFFKEYSAPLADYADLFVKVADQHGLDFRLLPAISMQESNGGKRIIPSSKNPFGYGIHGENVLKFNSFEEAIERVARGLKEDYVNQGLKDPTQIMAKYTPPALEKGGDWAKGVLSFMEELR
ncbi:glucosaminidase domain-containing protein [Candidatus Daviesbacteria bacterium]|nr:glucosaminidase domain-containing protein [Candidatus Daviesbacteria bacterium]